MKEERDLYTKDLALSGLTYYKGEKIPKNYYPLVVMIAIQNSKKEFLMQKRSLDKGGDWGVTGGHPKHGETPYEGIITEVKEELGIDISNQEIIEFKRGFDGEECYVMYYTKIDLDLTKLNIQYDELSEVKWFSMKKLKNMVKKGELNQNQVEFFNKCTAFVGHELNAKKKKFPIFKAGLIHNKYTENIFSNCLRSDAVEIYYPCRLDAMAINPAAVCSNDNMIFTPGEVVVSLKKFIKVKVKVKKETGGELKISNSTKRKSLVKHAYLLMCDALNVHPSLEISVDDKEIPKHCGFGSSSSTIAAVAASINELYGCPIKNENLIKYLASNHGEEVSDDDTDNLKSVQCIGGGATNGLTEEGIILISGKSTIIAKTKYDSDVLIAIPHDFVQKDAKTLMELEEKNLWRFKRTGNKYSKKIAYDLLHKVLPDIKNGNIGELSKIVFDYRFNMGSNKNCSFTYKGLMKISDKIRKLYENGKCDFLSLSSVGPAFFMFVSNSEQKKYCIKELKKLNLDVIESSICNSAYIVNEKNEINTFWNETTTSNEFQNRPPSKYITSAIDMFDIKNKKCIDIGCGGGRYSKYLYSKKAIVLALDKYPNMFNHSLNINFVKGIMSDIPVIDNSYYLALSIGVIHNSVTEEEYHKSFNEIYRLLEEGGIAIISIFTNDVITDDLIKTGQYTYAIKNRPPMVLYSKKKIKTLVNQIGFKDFKMIDEHITDVGGGKRNVFSFVVKK